MQYFIIVWKRLWLILLLLVVTEAVILTLSYTAKPVYRASVRLQVLATDRADVSLFTQYRSSSTVDEILQAQSDFTRALKSGFVAWKTIADLNLEIGALDLLAGLSTAAEGDFLIVTVESDDPGRAEDIANTQVDNALEYYRGVRATPSRVLREFVSGLLASEKENMLDAEKALLDFKQEHNLESIKQETTSLQDMLRSLKMERERALIEQERAAIFAQTYRAEQKKAADKADEIGAMTKDGEAEGEAQKEVAPYTQKFYLDLARQHEATALNYEAQRDGYARSLTVYDKAITERSDELRDLLGLYAEYNALERDLTQATNNYNFLWEKENEARLKQAQAEQLGYIQITEPARKPDAPVSSKTLQLAAAGGAASVLTGLVLAFLIEFLSSLGKAARKQRVS